MLLFTLSLCLLSETATSKNSSIKVIPKRESLLLGTDVAVEVTVLAPLGSKRIRLSTNAGALTAPVQQEAGRWMVRYSPPTQRHPQVAIIAASAENKDGVIHGWARLPLYGQGTALARSRPHAQVTVRLAGRKFGPVRANARGMARVPVEAPPGVLKAYGPNGAKIALNPPPFNRVHVHLPDAEMPADKMNTVGVRMYVIDPEGLPARKPYVSLKGSRGELSTPELQAPGVLTATWTLPPRAAGVDSVLVYLPNAASSKAEAPLRAVPGRVARLTLDAERKSLTPGKDKEATFIVAALDRVDNATDTAVRVLANGHRVTVTSLEKGQWRASVALDNIPSDDSLSVQAHVVDESAIWARAAVSLKPGPAVALRMYSEHGSIEADGSQGMTVHLHVVDAHGNVRPSSAKLEAPGTITSGAAVGKYLYTPQRVLRRARMGKIVARAEDLATSVPVHLLPTRGSWVLSSSAGMLADSSLLRGPIVSVQGAWWPAWNLGFELGFRVALDYAALFAEETAQTESGTGLSVASTTHLQTLALGMAWRYEWTPRWLVWAHASGGWSLVQSQLEVEALASEVAAGGGISGELAVAIGRRFFSGQLFLEAAFRALGDISVVTFEGKSSFFRVGMGFRYDVI